MDIPSPNTLLVIIAVVPAGWGLWRLAQAQRRARRLRTLAGLRALDPAAFERAVGAWFARDGWVVEHRGGPGDQGIDLLAFRGGDVVAVQCKRYAASGRVTPAQVRELFGAASAVGATRAMLVTTGTVTRAGRAWLEQVAASRPSLELVEGDRLAAIAAGQERLAGP